MVYQGHEVSVRKCYHFGLDGKVESHVLLINLIKQFECALNEEKGLQHSAGIAKQWLVKIL